MKLQTAILTAVLSVASCDQALFAADMPVKAKAAPKLFQVYPTDSGFYWGLGSYGEATKLSVAPAAGVTTSTFEAGGNLRAGGGYVYSMSANRKIAAEVWANLANTGANQAGVSVSNKVSATGRLLYIGDSSWISRLLPNLSMTDIFPGASPLPTNAPMCPSVVACNPLTLPYIGLEGRIARTDVAVAGISNRSTRGAYGFTAGFKTPLADGSVVDTWTSATSSSGAHLAGINNGIVARQGVTYMAGVTIEWGVSRN